MIKGIGIDTVEIRRMEESIKRSGFMDRVFTVAEKKNEHGNKAEYYATRFACKEAVAKATGNFEHMLEVETLNDEDGKPYVTNVKNVLVSITTEAGMATAIALWEEEK